MNTSQTKSPLIERTRLFWVKTALLLSLPLAFYYGYCWGLWGRNSLLLQYLFQCGCPAASEEARYPEYVDVLVPACKYLDSIHSPSGRLLYVTVEESGTISTYLLNLETGERTPFTLPDGSPYFLTDDLIFYSIHGNDGYVFDIKTSMTYPIERFTRMHSDAYVNGEINLRLLAEELRGMENIFLIDNDFIIALASDFQTSPEHSFLSGWFDIPGSDPDAIQRFLQNNEITYGHVPDRFPGELISPGGMFVARADGIYLSETKERIVEGHSGSATFLSGEYFSVRGWIYDNSGALYSKSIIHWPCLIEGPTLADVPLCIFRVPQPLLMLKVPKEYLISVETP
jgi:hypothetical protein